MSVADVTGERKRSAIRRSWPLAKIYKKPPSVNVTVKFVIGTMKLSKDKLVRLGREQATFGDLLLLEDHLDTYHKLTEKVCKAVLWVDKHVVYDYLVKTDDDVVVRLDNMVERLRQMGFPERLYWGHMTSGSRVRRRGKWKEIKWHVCRTYLPYATGNGYVLGRLVVRLALKYVKNLSHFVSEDLTMGFWLIPYNIERKWSRDFPMKLSCSESVILTHLGNNVRQLEKAASNLLKKGTVC